MNPSRVPMSDDELAVRDPVLASSLLRHCQDYHPRVPSSVVSSRGEDHRGSPQITLGCLPLSGAVVRTSEEIDAAA